MEDFAPRVIENRDFVDLEEEDIQRLNRSEAAKFGQNPRIGEVLALIETELNNSGHWEEHWLTIDLTGRRVYARIYYGQGRALAVTADGRILRKIDFPPTDENRLVH